MPNTTYAYHCIQKDETCKFMTENLGINTAIGDVYFENNSTKELKSTCVTFILYNVGDKNKQLICSGFHNRDVNMRH